jgi:hypothetical protein
VLERLAGEDQGAVLARLFSGEAPAPVAATQASEARA